MTVVTQPHADVVIAGGGPVGLMLACELGLAGVRTVVVERAPDRDPFDRAWGLHARTVETLDRRDLVDGLIENERSRWPRMPFAGLWPLMQLREIGSDHPYLLNAPQTRVEEVLEARAQQFGVPLRRGHEVVALADGADRVTVDVSGPDGLYRIDARYLVGCDGGRSTVRKLTGIGFPGTDPTVAGMLCDCALPTMAQEKRGITRTDRGTVNLNLRPSGMVRIVTTEFDRTHPDRDAPVEPAEFTAAVRRILGRDLAFEDPTYLTRFSDTTRQADRYRAGRVLLAGDAAHVHFPYGGLGLNVGIQDAVNLGWKLAAEVAGWAPDGLLDTYHAERHPAGAEVLEYSRTQLALFQPGRNVTALRDLFARLLELPEVNRHLAELVAGVSGRYQFDDGAHPLVGGFAADLELAVGGDRTTLVRLLRAGKAVLLDLTGTGAAASAGAGWPRVSAVRADCDKPPAPALLVRPDGYVVWAAADADNPTGGLPAALERWFGAAG